jgi:DNA-directed RNA polymerase alpha subunit
LKRQLGLVYQDKLDKNQPEQIANMPIEYLEFDLRTYNALKKLKVKTLSDLEGIKKTDVLKVKNFGSKSLQHLEQKLKAYNISLREGRV